jgi:hypothetical protein
MRSFVALLFALILVGACSGAGAPRPSSFPTPIPGAIIVTRANDQGTVYARVGDRIQIALGTDFEWRLDPPDGVVLTRGVQNEPLVRGTQGVWTAAAPGTSTITATGTVICPSGKACILIAILFKTTVVVSP